MTEAWQCTQAVCATAALLYMLGRKDDYSLQCCSSLPAPKTIMLPPLSNLLWLKNLVNPSLQGIFSSPVLWVFFCLEGAFEETVWVLYIFRENRNLEAWLLANLNTKWQPWLVFTKQCLLTPCYSSLGHIHPLVLITCWLVFHNLSSSQ